MKALVLACLWMSIGLAQQPSDLAGRWRSVQTSKGGIGAMYDFFADGTERFSPGAIVPTQYRLDGDKLTTYPQDGPSFTVSWTGADRMRFSVGSAGEDYTRLGEARDPSNPLIGEWTGKRDMGGQIVAVHWIFNSDSTALLMIRFKTMEGRYQLRDGRLDATFGGQPGLSGPISLESGILTIRRSGGRITRLQRY